MPYRWQHSSGPLVADCSRSPSDARNIFELHPGYIQGTTGSGTCNKITLITRPFCWWGHQIIRGVFDLCDASVNEIPLIAVYLVSLQCSLLTHQTNTVVRDTSKALSTALDILIFKACFAQVWLCCIILLYYCIIVLYYIVLVAAARCALRRRLLCACAPMQVMNPPITRCNSGH